MRAKTLRTPTEIHIFGTISKEAAECNLCETLTYTSKNHISEKISEDITGWTLRSGDRAPGLCQYVPIRTDTYPVRTADGRGALRLQKAAPAGRLKGEFLKGSPGILFVRNLCENLTYASWNQHFRNDKYESYGMKFVRKPYLYHQKSIFLEL